MQQQTVKDGLKNSLIKNAGKNAGKFFLIGGSIP